MLIRKTYMKIVLGIFIMSSVFIAVAQEQPQQQEEQQAPADSNINANVTLNGTRQFDTGNQVLKEVSIDTFEDPGLWVSEMPIDLGIAKSRRLYGSPNEKTPLSARSSIPNYNPVDSYVIGMKVDFFHRGNGRVSLKAKRPIFIPGIVKELSLWVAGRNKGHNLKVVLEDVRGNRKILGLGDMRFRGWKKMSVLVPSSIDQKDINGTTYGLYIIGFVIDMHFEDTEGTYYVYFDDLRATSDFITEYLYYEDDISDRW